MSKAPRKAVIVSHTHWDREWYLPLHRFRVDFASMLRKVLDLLEEDGEFRHFLLDGQTLVLEDHLHTNPEDADRVRDLAEDGRLSLGPWYVLPDEFLVSGEATVRNLQFGHEVARACGGVQKVGYMADSFGHLAQMPQILRGVGIDNFIYTRGNGDEIDELGWSYRWRAPDGSEVLALNQCEGYCNAGGLGHEELWHAHTSRDVEPDRAVARVGELFEKSGARPHDETLLVSNGCDHFPPQRDFEAVISALREAYPSTEFLHGSYSELLEQLRADPRERDAHEGELLSGKLHLILPGVWSARMPLKQRNDRCQMLLSAVLEPLSAAYEGQEGDQGLIDYAWKKLIENHPHDSICGCSIDEVHREMDTRFDQVEQTARAILNRQLDSLLPLFGRKPEEDRDTTILVANPLPERRAALIERLVVLQPIDYDIDNLQLVDQDGRMLPFQILNRWTVERFWGVDYRAELFGEDQLAKFAGYRRDFAERILKDESEAAEHDTFLHVLFRADDLPPVGHRLFQLREGEGSYVHYEHPVQAGPNWIQNEQVRVELHDDGRFDLIDRNYGRSYKGLGFFEDVADIGDEYDFGALPGDEPIDTKGIRGEICCENAGPLRGRLVWSGSMRLPRALARDRQSRSEESVDCPMVIRLTLDIDSPLVDVQIDLANSAEDHRLRAIFPTGIVSNEVVSDGQFMLNRRSLDFPDGSDWAQPPTGAFPQQDFSWVADEAGGMALLVQGLPEVSARRDSEGRLSLELTLLRSVGWLSRDDFADRKFCNAGPTLPTPDAQCLGSHRFRFAILPFQGDGVSAGVKRASDRWRTPLPARQGVKSLGRPGGNGLLWGCSEKVAISALRRHPRRGTLCLRLYNLTGETVEETLGLGFDATGVTRCDILDERSDVIAMNSPREFDLSLRPFEILSLEILS